MSGLPPGTMLVPECDAAARVIHIREGCSVTWRPVDDQGQDVSRGPVWVHKPTVATVGVVDHGS